MQRRKVRVTDRQVTINDLPITIPSVRVESMLGSGANGVVFSGSDTLGRNVAVKVWLPRTGISTSMQQLQIRALSEIRKVSKLKHPNLATIYFADVLKNGWPYVVMERAPGKPLRALRNQLRHKVEIRQAIVGQVLRALEAAERFGIVHGDIHEGNIIVDGSAATVIDFGTSLLAGKANSKKRHARLLRNFMSRTLPEFGEWFPPRGKFLGLVGLEVLPTISSAFTVFLMLKKKTGPVILMDNGTPLGEQSWPPDPVVIASFLAGTIDFFEFEPLLRQLKEIYPTSELTQIRETIVFLRSSTPKH